jgi:hypothetical protein
MLEGMRKLDESQKTEAQRLSVRVDGPLLARLLKQAEIERRTVGQMVRILLEDRLAEINNDVEIRLPNRKSR